MEMWFALMCFLLWPEEEFDGEKTTNDLKWSLLEDVSAVSSGLYIISANIGGMYVLSCDVRSTLTEERHVKDAWGHP
jgi:tyrosine decarboxylase